ncbi:acyl carrier protein [Tengunoibacter tsumagoiensis]|uniref:Carrier domain-containing protein n=1 Tax=Tengunoibacter tsumagoiensis TaxID=2014871 RepID=A0A402A941_9CHLR|nr:acyl carrier protein [Tengunoibacter tsumagoiensis]GCE15663.1 hypothetical protein KTT_55220 [Tengunoibacter tsumagoiensis]
MEIRTKVLAFLQQFFNSAVLGDDQDFFAMGFVNSLFAMQLVLFVEKEFGITVDNDDLDIDNFRTIRAIVSLVERKQSVNAL